MAFTAFSEYRTREITSFSNNVGDRLIVEMATVHDPYFPSLNIKRVQVSTDTGRIVAYTPSRLSAIPLCLSKTMCWVFMWKTVYPFPAVYKFDVNQRSWNTAKSVPMQYTRSGPYYKGFTQTYNPVFWLIGVFMFFVKYCWFFLLCIMLSILLCLQISKYRDMSDKHRRWIRNILFLLTLPIKTPFVTIEPYTITAFAIVAWAGFGVSYLAVPFTLTSVAVMLGFFICAYRMGKLRRAKL